jgi:hypothetical protein
MQRMISGAPFDANMWIIRAEEAIELAQNMHDPEAERIMLRIAADYMELAGHYEGLSASHRALMGIKSAG